MADQIRLVHPLGSRWVTTTCEEEACYGLERGLFMPDHTTHHGADLRGEAVHPLSPFFEGRFGRMFRALPHFTPTDQALKDLAGHTFEQAGADRRPRGGGRDPRQNPDMPAGYTYCGQFIDHDITFDPASSLQRQNDPDALHDFRTPRFDLDSLYGRGPADDPFLCDQSPADSKLAGIVFLIGSIVGN